MDDSSGSFCANIFLSTDLHLRSVPAAIDSAIRRAWVRDGFGDRYRCSRVETFTEERSRIRRGYVKEPKNSLAQGEQARSVSLFLSLAPVAHLLSTLLAACDFFCLGRGRGMDVVWGKCLFRGNFCFSAFMQNTPRTNPTANTWNLLQVW